MPITLVCTLGRLDRYKTPIEYRHGTRSLGEAIVPVTAVARAFPPDRILAICPGAAEETARWFSEELEPMGLPTPIVETVPIPHEDEDVARLLQHLIPILGREAEAGNELHLDFSLGLRFISLPVLQAFDYLASMAGTRIIRVTCINHESPRDSGVTEILDITPYRHLERLRAAAESLALRGDLVGAVEAIDKAFPGSLAPEDIEDASDLQRRLFLLRTRQIGSNKGRQLLRHLLDMLDKHAASFSLITPIARDIHRHLEPLLPGNDKADSPQFLSRIARWYLDHGQPALALILTDEAAEHFENRHTPTPTGLSYSHLHRTITRRLRNSLAHAQLDTNDHQPDLSSSEINDAVSYFESLAR